MRSSECGMKTASDIQTPFSRVAVLLGAEVSSQLLTDDNPLKVKVELLATLALFQLRPVFAAMQDGDFTTAARLWDRVPGRFAFVSRPIYDEWQKKVGPGKPL